MKLKGIELNGTYKVKFEDTWFVVFDEKGNKIYIEFSSGDWKKSKFNEKGKEIYYETDKGYCIEFEYDDKGDVIYLETSDGYIMDDRKKLLKNNK